MSYEFWRNAAIAALAIAIIGIGGPALATEIKALNTEPTPLVQAWRSVESIVKEG